jgi:hypothetical protein
VYRDPRCSLRLIRLALSAQLQVYLGPAFRPIYSRGRDPVWHGLDISCRDAPLAQSSSAWRTFMDLYWTGTFIIITNLSTLTIPQILALATCICQLYSSRQTVLERLTRDIPSLLPVATGRLHQYPSRIPPPAEGTDSEAPLLAESVARPLPTYTPTRKSL